MRSLGRRRWPGPANIAAYDGPRRWCGRRRPECLEDCQRVARRTKSRGTAQFLSEPSSGPTIGLVVAGDAVYNGIHPFLNESNRQTRREWIAALDKIDALNPSAVVAGHKIPGNDDSCGRNAPVHP